MDRFEDMQTFVAVADRRSVRQAAEHLSRAPSAVSRRIKDLEARLSTQLLTRTTRQIRLTAAGERFLVHAKRILAELQEAEENAATDTQLISGELRITMPLSFGLAHLNTAISDFMLENSSVNIDADLTDRIINLTENQIDLAVRIGTLADSTLRARKLAPIHHVVAASPDFWAEHGIPRTPEKLSGLSALCYSNLATPHTWPWTNSVGRSGLVVVKPRYRASNGDALVHAAIRGLGVVRLPTFMINSAIESGELEPVLLSINWGVAGLYALYPDTAFLPHRTRAFIDYLQARFGDEPTWDKCLRTHLKRIHKAPSVSAYYG
jgi:DNA-binding transcriptional LysR family regulator